MPLKNYHDLLAQGIRPTIPRWSVWNLDALGLVVEDIPSVNEHLRSDKIIEHHSIDKLYLPKLNTAKRAALSVHNTQEGYQRVQAFNVTQNSVLVAWFLQLHGIRPVKTNIVMRTEITSSPPLCTEQRPWNLQEAAPRCFRPTENQRVLAPKNVISSKKKGEEYGTLNKRVCRLLPK